MPNCIIFIATCCRLWNLFWVFQQVQIFILTCCRMWYLFFVYWHVLINRKNVPNDLGSISISVIIYFIDTFITVWIFWSFSWMIRYRNIRTWKSNISSLLLSRKYNERSLISHHKPKDYWYVMETFKKSLWYWVMNFEEKYNMHHDFSINNATHYIQLVHHHTMCISDILECPIWEKNNYTIP